MRHVPLLATASLLLWGAPLAAQGTTPAPGQPVSRYQIAAPKGAPNIVIVLLDDVGFGAASTFGGPVATPSARRASGKRPTPRPNKRARR